jgi:hypothetical protein
MGRIAQFGTAQGSAAEGWPAYDGRCRLRPRADGRTSSSCGRVGCATGTCGLGVAVRGFGRALESAPYHAPPLVAHSDRSDACSGHSRTSESHVRMRTCERRPCSHRLLVVWRRLGVHAPYRLRWFGAAVARVRVCRCLARKTILQTEADSAEGRSSPAGGCAQCRARRFALRPTAAAVGGAKGRKGHSGHRSTRLQFRHLPLKVRDLRVLSLRRCAVCAARAAATALTGAAQLAGGRKCRSGRRHGAARTGGSRGVGGRSVCCHVLRLRAARRRTTKG